MITTADRADSFLRRQSMWQRLIDLFKTSRPNDEQLGRVSTISEVAIDQVFTAYNLTPEECDERHGLVKDYAECAALYGYQMGYHDALAQRAATIPVHRVSGD